MIKTVEERNQEARARMIDKGTEQLVTVGYNLSLGDIVEYTHAVVQFAGKGVQESNNILARFLMANIDYSDVGEAGNIIPRYKSISLYGGLKNALRDWDNMWEIGK